MVSFRDRSGANIFSRSIKEREEVLVKQERAVNVSLKKDHLDRPCEAQSLGRPKRSTVKKRGKKCCFSGDIVIRTSRFHREKRGQCVQSAVECDIQEMRSQDWYVPVSTRAAP